MNDNSAGLVILCIVFLISALLFPCLSVAKAENLELTASTNEDYSHVVQEINQTKIENHLSFLSGIDSRVPGSPGFYNATEYIISELEKNQIDVYLENFTTIIPVVDDATITILSYNNLSISAYPLWPNLIETCETPTAGLIGHLIYVGSGEMDNFNGKDVNGSVVLMEFNSGRNWMNAMMLGAKAIVFIEPNDTTTNEASQKFLQIPLEIPRLYIKKSSGDFLKNLLATDQVEIKINLEMRFENKEVSNIIGIINGTDPVLKNEIVALSAHYDTISVAPSLAPGADETGGIAALLELARVFKESPTKRTTMFIAFACHDFALQGAREFVDKHFDDIGSKIKLLLNIDLSAETDQLVALWVGQFYQFNLDPGRFMWISQRISGVYVPELYQVNEKYSGKIINAMDVSSWQQYVPRRFVLDSEPFTVSGGLGFSLMTAGASERHFDTSCDTLNYLSLENIKMQTDMVSWIFHSISDEDQLPDYRAFRFNSKGGGFPVLTGRVVTYNSSTGWYNPVPNALVCLQGGPATVLYGQNVVLISDENGEFEFKGCVQSIVGGGIYATRYYTLSAFVVDPSSGQVEYATDIGKYGAPMYPGQIIIDKADNFATIAVFKCASIAFFDCVDPFSLQPIQPALQVLDLKTYVAPDQWGACSDQGASIVFVPANQSVQILMSGSGGTQPIALLKNASSYNDVEGNGYKIKSIGDCLNLYDTPLLFAEDGLFQLTSSRLNVSQSKGLRPINIQQSQSIVYQHLRTAHEALNDKLYSSFYAEAFNAWSLEVQAYRATNGLMQDAIDTVVFFFALLIPFSFLIESLLFDFTEGYKRLVAASATLIVFIGVLYFFHPGFLLASNMFMTLIGLVVIILLSPTLSIIIGETFKYLGELRHRFIGQHFTSINRLGALSTSFSIGISNMKRRKLRTTLTLAAITLITFSLISFASIMSFSIIAGREKTGTTLYDGVLIRSPSWNPLSENILEYVEAQEAEQSIVCSRAWLYTSAKLTSQDGSEYLFSSILGVVPNESQLTKPNTALAEGSWFTDSNQRACIINTEASASLGVGVNGTVIWNGLNLTVVGIMNDDEMKAKTDLDQESIMPLHPIQVSAGNNVHSLPAQVLIIPFSLAKSFGAQVYSIAIMPNNSTNIYDIAKGLANTMTEVNVYAGTEGKIIFYIKGVGYEFYGWELIIVPLIIAAFIILNSMLSSVHERTKEIAIYSSIGLSPAHIAGLFMAESIVYAVVGSVLGYTLGIVSYPVLISAGALPSNVPLNYSSSWVVITLSVCMLVTLLSTVYPMHKASRLVTPSIERSWKVPTKPTGDEWTIPLPFVAASEREGLGILIFLKEFFEAHSVERTDAVFASREIAFHEEGKSKILTLKVRLTPFEMGVIEEVRLAAIVPTEEERYHFELYMKRLDGHLRIWRLSSKKFADEIRKQLLIWRGLRQEDREKYMENASEQMQIKREGREE